MMGENCVEPVMSSERRILLIRGGKVMLDPDLAEVYGVATGRLDEQVKRSRERFPSEFMAGVLSSPVAVQASIQVVGAFVRLRRILASHKELAERLAELETRYDVQFKAVLDAIRELLTPPAKARARIGLRVPDTAAARGR